MKLVKGLLSLGLTAVACVAVVGCGSDTQEGSGQYTYNQSLSTFPNNWNPFTYQTATASDAINSYCESGLYTFDYNETLDGFEYVDQMAKGDPVDVTSQYVGEEWGIEVGDTARAWQVTIRNDLVWDDGTPITADTILGSYERLLAPEAMNYRADQYTYSGQLVIHNARNYLYQGQYVGTPSRDTYDLDLTNSAVGTPGAVSDFANLTSEQKASIYFNISPTRTLTADDAVAPFVSGNTIEQTAIGEYFGSNGFTYDDVVAYIAQSMLSAYLADCNYSKDQIESIMNAEAPEEGQTASEDYTTQQTRLTELVNMIDSLDLVPYSTIENNAQLSQAFGYCLTWWQTNIDEEFDFFVTRDLMPEVDFSEVGVQKVDDYTFVFVIDTPLDGFYLKYNIASLPLVKLDLYDSLASTSNGVYRNTYGTSVDTYSSYGPYKLTSFISDSQIILERNAEWFGFNDKDPGEHWYQTTRIVTQYIADDSAREQAFLRGNLDSLGLTSSNYEDYAGSDNLFYSSSESTFFVAINPMGDELDTPTVADRVLTNKNFRQGLSFAINRSDYRDQVTPTNNVATSLFSNYIISDPETGTSYRSEEIAKDVILDFWGLTDQVGEGKRYATKDEAIASITGFDSDLAKEHFNAAAEELIDSGAWDGTSTIEITIGMPSTSQTYVNGYNYLSSQWAQMVSGTPFEGKLTFRQDTSIADNFGEALRNGTVDILFMVGWSGSALDPFNLMSAYISDSQRYDQGSNYRQMTTDLHFDSVTVTDNGESRNLTDVTLRLNIYDLACTALAGGNVNAYLVNENGEYLNENGQVVSDPNEAKSYSFSAGSSQDYDVRLQCLAACESAVLQQYTMLPLIDDSSASLKSYKINYYTEEFVFGMGFGGIQYYTYNYDDAGWSQYVASQGGILSY